ncbi:FMN-dependent NADH-azoreductase [Anaeroselena agilis]|uniref:FMN dependent NADH:quinone oxidoreductase n=1 Tax=Anaeroselena agilis TaxID=3063788 RepID=A0ABU3P1M9_9FIRM|nr:FMN-dependent NADH-azoreductase [Selenomonadales bacterium 4137-cl]
MQGRIAASRGGKYTGACPDDGRGCQPKIENMKYALKLMAAAPGVTPPISRRQNDKRLVKSMAQVLAIIANPRKNSHTARLLQSFLTAYRKRNPADTIVELDLYKTEIPVIDAAVLEAWDKPAEQQTAAEKRLLAKVDRFTGQFIAADKVIIAAPMWNLQFPPMLPAYIATIAVAGKTFSYGDAGWKGLVPDKPVLLIHVRGGCFSSGPAQAFDHAVPYLKSLLAMLGISDLRTIICEGIEAAPDKAQDIFAQALLATEQSAAAF